MNHDLGIIGASSTPVADESEHFEPAPSAGRRSTAETWARSCITPNRNMSRCQRGIR